MRCQCGECGIIYGLKEPMGQDDITTGYCDECFEIIMNNNRIRRNKVRAEYRRQYHTLEMA